MLVGHPTGARSGPPRGRPQAGDELLEVEAVELDHARLEQAVGQLAKQVDLEAEETSESRLGT